MNLCNVCYDDDNLICYKCIFDIYNLSIKHNNLSLLQVIHYIHCKKLNNL